MKKILIFAIVGLFLIPFFAMQKSYAIPIIIDFESGIYADINFVGDGFEDHYEEKGISFDVLAVANQHFDSGPGSSVSSPYLSFHDGGSNSEPDNKVMVISMGGEPFDFISFDVIIPGNHGLCESFDIRIDGSDGSQMESPGDFVIPQNGGTIQIDAVQFGFQGVTSLTFDILTPVDSTPEDDLFCIDNLVIDNGQPAVGGKLISVEHSSLILAGVGSVSYWLIPVFGLIIGGVIYYKRKHN
jgi:hypothetical protein